MDKTYTVKQVAEILGYSTNSIYTFLKEKRIVGVRVGKGRFRIPQAELNKILHLKNPEAEQQKTPVQSLTPQPEESKIPSIEKHLEEIYVNTPSLFDWFVSLVAIVMGFTMILFTRNFEEFAKMPSTQLFLSIKMNLLVAGFGLLIINFINQARKAWFYIFYLIIFVNFIIESSILFLGKDLLGFLFFGLMVVMMIFQTILNLRKTISFKIFATLLMIIFPIILAFYPSVIDFNQISLFTDLSVNLVMIFAVVATGLTNIIIWSPTKEKKMIYWAGFVVVSIVISYYAYLYSMHLFWSRTLLFILVILFLYISTFWDSLNQNYKDNRRIVISIFTDLILIFIVIISLIWLIQNNSRIKIEQTLLNKLAYGQNIIETTIRTSQDKMESLANNKFFKDAYEKKDNQIRDALIKNIFDYSTTFKRIILVDRNGDVVMTLPAATLKYKNVAFRDYFKIVKSINRPYLSNVFVSGINGQKTEVVSINVPIDDDQGNFNGILIGAFDINMLSNNLQQIASQPDNEYFVLIDGYGNPIILPENIILSKSETGQLMKKNLNNFTVEEALDVDNKLIQIHNQVDSVDWRIAIRRPLLNTYNFDNTTNIFINLTFVISGMMIIYLNIIHINKP